jgi:hypothetical protein
VILCVRVCVCACVVRRLIPPSHAHDHHHYHQQALQEGWTRDETLAHAQREGLPFLKSAHLTDWVLGTVARCVVLCCVVLCVCVCVCVCARVKRERERVCVCGGGW